MKPLGLSCLAAGTIAAIAFFTYKEKAHSTPAVNVSAEVREVANGKTSNDYQSLIQSSKAVPYSQSEKTVAVEAGSSNTNTVGENALVSAEANDEADLKQANFSFKQSVIKQHINTNRLARKISLVNGSVVLNAAPSGNNLPVNAAEENSVVADRPVAGPMEPKSEMEADSKADAYVAPAMVTVPVSKSYTSGVAAPTAELKHDIVRNNIAQTSNVSFTSNKQTDKGADTYSYTALLEETQQLQEYAQKNGYNTDYAIIANLGIKQGKKRFFVVDLSSMTIMKNGIVAQGKGDSTASFEKRYSNELGSTASSLGMYKIGRPERENNFLCKLYGLEESNSNAAKRNLSLLGSDIIPYNESNYNVVNTDGNFTVSTRFLKEISNLLDQSEKPVLLWVFDQTAESQSLYSSIQNKP